MSAVVADLHVHTTRSDGAVAPDELAERAAAAGLEAVAATDHDRLPAWDHPVHHTAGVTVIGGIELRVESPTAGRIDLLGYGVEATPALVDRLETLQADRRDRARRMVDRLEATLDVSLSIDIDTGVGRPHIAAAVSDATELSAQAVFDRYIGDGGPCYVPRTIPSFEEGRRLLAEAATAVVLAHPLRYDDAAAAMELVPSLDGVEVAYPYDDPTDIAALEVTTDADRLETGGSDAHTVADIGRCGLDREGWTAAASHLGVAMD